MICKHCSKEIPDISNYCMFCGKPVNDQAKKQRKPLNPMCVSGLIIGVVSMFILGWRLSIVALLVSIYGVCTFKKEVEFGRFIGIIGIIASIVFVVCGISTEILIAGGSYILKRSIIDNIPNIIEMIKNLFSSGVVLR